MKGVCSRFQTKLKRTRKIAFPTCLALAVCTVLSLLLLAGAPAQAQLGNPQPPPPGDGNVPAPVTPGDQSGNTAPPTGQADPTPGTNFATGNGMNRTVVYIYEQSATGRGTRMVQTIRPDSLPADAQNTINGILGINMNGGQSVIQVNATADQIAQIQAALAPYPDTQGTGDPNNMGRNGQLINTDAPNAAYPKPGRESLYRFDGTIPTVATFCRYLIILGAVIATVYMAMAAWSMVMGNQYGAARVLGAATGLLFLLASYTIYKIVMMNMFHGNSLDQARPANRPDNLQDAFMGRPNLPVTPGGGTNNGANRGGVPVVPLGNANN